MIEKGRVVEIKGSIVVVEVEKQQATHCRSCSMCSKGLNGRVFLDTENNGRVSIGDIVEVRIDDTALLTGALFIYGLPAIGFAAGIYFSSLINQWFLQVVVFLAVFMTTWFYGLKKGNEIGGDRRPKIIKEKV